MISFFSRPSSWNGTRRDDRNIVSRVKEHPRDPSSPLSWIFLAKRDEEKDEESMQGDGQEKDATGHGISGTSGEICSIWTEREGNERWKERGETAGRPRCYSQGERSVHSLSDQKLKATLNEMNAFTCLLHLPRHIHSPFHFKCSAALLWVAALSPRPSRCTHRSLSLSWTRNLLHPRKFRGLRSSCDFDFVPSMPFRHCNVTKCINLVERTDTFAR